MSERQLPEDTASWPSNPFELLGVTYRDDAKTVRRAYVKLVRRFKPEHYPAQFQRIREAYDVVYRQAEFRQHDGYGHDDEAHLGTFEFSDIRPTEHSRSPFADPIQSQCDESWQLAIDGQDKDAYVKLLSLCNHLAVSSDVYAQLYWLLKLNPQLDGARSPCDWLAAGLRESRLTGPLRELYRRELEGSQVEAASARCTSLVECAAPPGPLADLVQWRWLASPLPPLIAQDLMRLREQLLPDDEATWLRLLLMAVDHLAWSSSDNSGDLLRRCVDEIQHLEHLHQASEHELDRLELLLEISDQWWKVEHSTGISDEWKRLIPLSWAHPLHQIRPRLLPLVRSIAENPTTGLATFDRLANHSPGAAAQLGESIEMLNRYERSYGEDGLDGAAIWRLLGKLIATHGRDYHRVRQPLLTFCLENAVDPSVVGRIADDHQWHSWSDSISGDGPFRYVYAAYRHIWG